MGGQVALGAGRSDGLAVSGVESLVWAARICLALAKANVGVKRKVASGATRIAGEMDGSNLVPVFDSEEGWAGSLQFSDTSTSLCRL